MIIMNGACTIKVLALALALTLDLAVSSIMIVSDATI